MLKGLIALFVLIVIFVGAGVGGWIYTSLSTPHAHDKSNQFIQIPRGSSPGDIAEKLQSEGIIRSALVMQIYLRINGGSGDLKAGEYQFNSPITPLQVIEELKKGEERTTKLTIPEGWTRYDIAKEIAEKFPQNPPMDDKAVLTL